MIEEVSKLRDGGKFDEAIEKIDIKMEDLKDPSISEYVTKLEEIKNELVIEKESREKFSNELEELEEKLESARENNNLEEVLNNCSKILELAKENERIEIVERYSQVSNQVKQEIEEKQAKFEEEFKEKINKLSKEGMESLNKSAFQESLDNFENIISLLEEYSKNTR